MITSDKKQKISILKKIANQNANDILSRLITLDARQKQFKFVNQVFQDKKSIKLSDIKTKLNAYCKYEHITFNKYLLDSLILSLKRYNIDLQNDIERKSHINYGKVKHIEPYEYQISNKILNRSLKI